MAVTIRLSRFGQKKRPFYRIVAAEKCYRRDGRFLERVGTYNPMVDPAAITLKEDRVRSLLEDGAQISDTVKGIIKKSIPGLIEEREEKKRSKIQANRKKRKARSGTPDKPKEKKKKRGRKSGSAPAASAA